MQLIIKVSFGCQINYIRNTRASLQGGKWTSSDIDGSKECNYDICLYTCASKQVVKKIDYSTYDVNFLDYNCEKIIKMIKFFYQKQFQATFIEIKRSIFDQYDSMDDNFDSPYLPYERNNPREKHILYSLFLLIDKKEILRDRFGRATYLSYDKGVFYLSEHPVRNSSNLQYLDSYYSKNFFFTEKNSLWQAYLLFEVERLPEIIKKLIKEPKEDLKESISNYSKENQAFLLEWAFNIFLRKVSEKKEKSLSEKIIKIYKEENMWKEIKIPKRKIITEKLRLIKERDKKNAIKYGKPLTDEQKEEILKRIEDEEETIYVHFLSLLEGVRSEYGVSANLERYIGRLRLREKQAQDWRDAYDFEKLPYQELLEALRLEQKSVVLGTEKIYGIEEISNKGIQIFKIVDHLESTRGKGRNCPRGVFRTRSSRRYVAISVFYGIPATRTPFCCFG
jgi:hypothetical protein